FTPLQQSPPPAHREHPRPRSLQFSCPECQGQGRCVMGVGLPGIDLQKEHVMVRNTTLLLLAVPLAAACATPGPDGQKYLRQGTWELEGTASLTHSEDDNTDTDHFDINSTMGYSVTDQLQIGPLLLVDLESTDIDDADLTIDRDIIGVGPNVRFN